jgi:hypothetical protein
LRVWAPKINLPIYSPSHLMRKRFCKLRNELNILDFSNTCWCTLHSYDMPFLRAIQGKSWLACIHPLLRTYLVHLVIPHVL